MQFNCYYSTPPFHLAHAWPLPILCLGVGATRTVAVEHQGAVFRFAFVEAPHAPGTLRVFPFRMRYDGAFLGDRLQPHRTDDLTWRVAHDWMLRNFMLQIAVHYTARVDGGDEDSLIVHWRAGRTSLFMLGVVFPHAIDFLGPYPIIARRIVHAAVTNSLEAAFLDAMPSDMPRSPLAHMVMRNLRDPLQRIGHDGNNPRPRAICMLGTAQPFEEHDRLSPRLIIPQGGLVLPDGFRWYGDAPSRNIAQGPPRGFLKRKML